MITSVHVAKIGLAGAVFRGVKPSKTPGLLSADGGALSALGPSVWPRPDITRVGMVAFWDDVTRLIASSRRIRPGNDWPKAGMLA